jgi:hypothetical protein
VDSEQWSVVSGKLDDDNRLKPTQLVDVLITGHSPLITSTRTRY